MQDRYCSPEVATGTRPPPPPPPPPRPPPPPPPPGLPPRPRRPLKDQGCSASNPFEAGPSCYRGAAWLEGGTLVKGWEEQAARRAGPLGK